MSDANGGTSEVTPASADQKTPLGRRLFLGLLGAGALGTIFGQQLQSLVGSALQPFTNSSGSGIADLIPGADRFRFYTEKGDHVTVKGELEMGDIAATSVVVGM